MKIRKSTEEDIPRMLEIYQRAREFMAAHGNPNQWGRTGWPPKRLLYEDIDRGKSYVCTDDNGNVIGTFFYNFGQDIEPTYQTIVDGAWLDAGPYGVVHRIAVDGSAKGTATFCLDWAFRQSNGHLRIDTHGDNLVMQNLLKKLGFTFCGTIFIEEDDDPRIAYEKVSDRKPADMDGIVN